MFYSRIAVSMAAVALTLASPGLVADVPAHAAESSDPPTAKYTDCTQYEGGQVLDEPCPFPDFKLDHMPPVVAGQTVTFHGSGARTEKFPGVPRVVSGRIDRIRWWKFGPTQASVQATVEADGAWSLTLTAPTREETEDLGPLGVHFRIFVDAGEEGHLSYSVSYPVEVLPDPTVSSKGWYQVGGTWYWGDAQGYRVKGWKNINGNWYFFDPATAAMRTGWVEDGPSWYYLRSSGAMATGWVEDKGSWCYLNSSGQMRTGWVRDGSSFYFLRPNGVMATGWVEDGGSWYFLKPSGAMATGWVEDGGSWYFLKPSGAMATGWVVVDGRWSLFAPNGAWQHYG